MKKYLSLLPLFILCQSVWAQHDSLAIAKAVWNRKMLNDGVVWKTCHFDRGQLFGANQYLSIIEIGKNSPKARLTLGYSDSLAHTSAIAKRYGAIAAINGSFFKMKGPDPDHQSVVKIGVKPISKNIGNRSIVYLRVADSLISENVFASDSLRRRHQQGIIAITNGKLSIHNTIASNLYWERTFKADDLLATGPVMLMSGKEQPIPNDAFCTDRHPRTAVGKKADGTVLLLTVDGRTSASSGMSIVELMRVMRWLGCTEAINLDGGGSTTMYVAGQPENGVVNHPSDNKLFDSSGERPVANVILLLPQNNKP